MTTLSHDRFFKEFFRRFLPAFLHLFFPEATKQIDFATLRFPDKEFLINLPEQEARIGDIVAEARTVSGDPQAFMIHVEVEKRDKKTLPYRLFEYYSLIRIITRLPVWPIAFVLVPGTKGLSEEVYSEGLFGRETLLFRYGQIGLRDLPAELYSYSNNPLAVTLALLMKVPGRGKAKWQRLAEMKLHTLQLLQETEDLTEGDKLFLIDLIKRYLPAESFPAGLRGETMQALQESEMFWSERVRYEGQQIGQQIGRQIGKQEVLLRQLKRKFGGLPADFLQQFEAISDPDRLDEIGDQLLTATSLDQILLLYSARA